MDTFESIAQKTLPQDSPAICLLDKNDAGRGVYTSHLDRSPVGIKIKMFPIPLILHILYAAVAIWRARNNYRVIVAVVLNDFYYIEPRGLLGQNGFWSWCWTFAVAIFDYYLIKELGCLLYDFVTDQLWLRLRYGFRENEVVLRIPSHAAWQSSLLRATSHRFLVGYTPRCPPWELCYMASADAYQLANEGVFDLENWESSVWHKNGHSQWTVLKVRTPSNRLTLDILQEKLQLRGKDAFSAKLEVIVQTAADVGPAADAKNLEDLSKIVENIFQEEGLDLKELWAEAETEGWRRLNQPLFQLYFP